MTQLDKHYSVKYKLKPKPVLPTWDWLSARSEVKKGVCALCDETGVVYSPRIDKFKNRYAGAMRDIYQQALVPIRESTERELAWMNKREAGLEATFERFVKEDVTETSLRRALDELLDCRGEMAERLTDLLAHMDNVCEVMLCCFEVYCIRMGKYVEKLSKRYKRKLTQGYGAHHYPVFAQLAKERAQVEARLVAITNALGSAKELYEQRAERIIATPRP